MRNKIPFVFLFILTLGAGGMAAVSITQAQPVAHAVVVDCGTPGGPGVNSPTSLVLTCADAGVTLTQLTWKGWGMPVATGHGDLNVNNCVPDCASSVTTTYHDVTVALGDLRNGHYYTKLTVDHSINGSSGTIYYFYPATN